MNSVSQEDMDLSLAVLAYLHAIYSGKYAGVNMLSRMQSREFSSSDLVHSQKTLGRLEGWIKQLFAGQPLLKAAWTRPETHEAASAFELLTQQRLELLDLAEKLATILNKADYSSDKDYVAFLVGGFGRFAYTRHTYISAYLDYAAATRNGQLQEQYRALLPQAEGDVGLADMFVQIVTAPMRPPVQFFSDLRDECVNLPGVFRSNAHDVAQLLASLTRPFSFKLAEIDERRAKGWIEIGVEPEVAGYWEAFAFSPREMQEWEQASITDPTVASACRIFGFKPNEAAPWLQLGIIPRLARRWRDAGYAPDKAADLIKQGVPLPTQTGS